MEYFREELLPYVSLTALHTDKFKTGCLSATLLAQLKRDSAAENAVLPYVLRRGTNSLPDLRALTARLDELYGAALEPAVRKRGEIQCIGFFSAFCEDRFLPGKPGMTDEMAKLLSEVLLSPRTRGGLLLPDYVSGERDKLIERIDAVKNDKWRYAARRLLETMCACEDYGVSAMGDRDEAESLHYVGLSKNYKNLLATAPIEFFYCGGEDPENVADTLRTSLLCLSRGEVDDELGTDIRMNALEAQPRYVTEELDVAQGNLALGFRLGKCMEDPDPAALRVFNAVYGGSVTSKLFTNVREKLSLCYDASSSVDIFKGILAVSSGIAFEKYDEALAEILTQLDAVREGNITADELSGAKKSVAGRLRILADSPQALEDFYLSQTMLGLDYGPMELAELVEDVTADEVAAIAQGVELDTVYFLKGEDT